MSHDDTGEPAGRTSSEPATRGHVPHTSPARYGITWDIADRAPTAEVTIPQTHPYSPQPAYRPATPPPLTEPAAATATLGSLPPSPRAVRRRPGWRRLLAVFGVLAAAGATAVIVAAWPAQHRSPPGGADTGSSPSPVPSTTPTGDSAAAEARLLALLPGGYSPGACVRLDPGPDVRAALACDANADLGGPASSNYQLLDAETDLDSTLFDSISGADIIDCPGRIQSPGPWRRNAAPNQAAGTLVCAHTPDHHILAWTDTERRTVVVARTATDEQQAIVDLYQWWSSHS